MVNQQQYQNRIFVIMALLCLAGLVLVFRLAQWQIFGHNVFLEKANIQNKQEIELEPARGNIYDCANHLLAGDTVQYEISASPNLISDPQKTTDRLYRLLNVPRETLLEELSSDKVWVRLNPEVSYEVGNTLLEWDITGISVTPHPKRAYPEGSLAAHLLGFVNNTRKGFYGIEGYYNEYLTGAPGKQAGEHGPFGDLIPMADFQLIPAVQGADIYLTVNRAVQQVIEEELATAITRYGAESGSIAVLNPKTGALLGSANWPTYDPNNFSTTEQALFIDPLVSKPYEPGSVFKIITMGSALDAAVVTPGTTVYDGGVIEIGGNPIYNSDRQAYGLVDMTTVLAKSLNVGTAQIAVAMGAEKFYTYVKRFGFGRLTEIGLSGESQGALRTSADADWYENYLATNSFGQGLAATPIQVLSAVAAVANDGLLMKPYITQKIITYGSEGRTIEFEPEALRRTISADTAAVLTQMLVSAQETENSPALIPGYRIAGKSGTAEIPIPGGYHPDLTIASFVGYFPADDPQVVILVILNKPTVSKWGNQTAAPTFRLVGERLAGLLDIPPDDIRLAKQP